MKPVPLPRPRAASAAKPFGLPTGSRSSWRSWRRSTTWSMTKWKAPLWMPRPRFGRYGGERHAGTSPALPGAESLMTLSRLSLACAGVGLLFLLLPPEVYAWTPGTHIYLGESVLANLPHLPSAVADLLRAYPFDFLYGNIAADSSIAKHYAPLGRHCHYWHVGQEIHDLAPSDALRAFGLGYLSHLAADTIAHNYFVPRQLMLTSSTAAVGHSYWETRVEAHLGDAYARAAKDVILLDHAPADAHLDRIIAPTIFSVRTNRRLFRGMVHLTETTSWQRASQVAREYSRWPLTDEDVERHLGLSFDFMMELLNESVSSARHLDPSGERPAENGKGDAAPGHSRSRSAGHRRAAGSRQRTLRPPRPGAGVLEQDLPEASLARARRQRPISQEARERLTAEVSHFRRPATNHHFPLIALGRLRDALYCLRAAIVSAQDSLQVSPDSPPDSVSTLRPALPRAAWAGSG